MIKFRLNERNINRLIVLLALLAPLVYLFGSLFFGLAGAHGSQVFGDGVSDYSAYIFGQFFDDGNWVKSIGDDLMAGTVFGFQPFAVMLRYLDAHTFDIGSTSWGAFLYGYSYYALHVVCLDLVVYILLFIPRIFKKALHTLEGGSKND